MTFWLGGLVLPRKIGNWSLTSLQQRLVRTAGRLIKHARYYWLLLAESHLTRRPFVAMVRSRLARRAGVDGGGAVKIRRPGSDGGRGVHGMHWKKHDLRVLVSCAGAKVAFGRAENGSRSENGNSEGRRMAAGCILSQNL
jgi:hypothetical protein